MPSKPEARKKKRQIKKMAEEDFKQLSATTRASFRMGMSSSNVAKTIYDNYDHLLHDPSFLDQKLRDLPMEKQPTTTTDEWEIAFLAMNKAEKQAALTEIEDAAKELLQVVARRRNFFEKVEFDEQIEANVFLEDVIEDMKRIKVRREFEISEMKAAVKKAKRDASPPIAATSPGTPDSTGSTGSASGSSLLMGLLSSAFSSSTPK